MFIKKVVIKQLNFPLRPQASCPYEGYDTCKKVATHKAVLGRKWTLCCDHKDCIKRATTDVIERVSPPEEGKIIFRQKCPGDRESCSNPNCNNKATVGVIFSDDQYKEVSCENNECIAYAAHNVIINFE